MDWDDLKTLYSDKDLWFFKTMSEVNAAQGVTLLGVLPNGFMGIGAKNLGNLDTLFDLNVKQDALIRSASIDSLIAQVEAFGFRVTTIPYADLYSALQTGIADGWYGGSLISNNVGFKDVIKYFVEYKAVNEPMGMLISTKTMESLPAEYQELLIKIAEDEALTGIADVQAAEEAARTALEEYGITIITPTDEELQEVAKIVREKVYPLFAEEFGEELMNEIYAWVENLD
jgi:TRAP-type C4-dicarboxylate transport system substrate-binding protein